MVALKYRATIDRIANTFHPYLTMAEGLKLGAGRPTVGWAGAGPTPR
ncbi:MAG: hypothetical protein Q8Q52_03005 [Acidimicrobiia bacterium]|nr:hypothetical protein [Acidimicrobiia bacterium]